MPKRRRVRIVAALVVVALGLAGVVVGIALTRPSLTPAERAALERARLVRHQERLADRAGGALTVKLPTRDADEPPIPPTLYKNPLPAHEVVGFMPWWELSQVSALDLQDASVVCYYGLSVEKNGSLARADQGAAALSSSTATSLLAKAHDDGDDTLLTLDSLSNAVITSLASHPARTAAALANDSGAIVRAEGFQGVDLDLEGTKAAERAGFVRFVADFTKQLHKADPGALVMLDTYAGSAGDPDDFFNVKALAPLVDQIFVMAYDMNNTTQAGSNDPLVTNDLGPSDVQALLQYEKLVPKKKLVLGLPFYGYDFSTLTDSSNSPLLARAPEAVTYSAVVRAAHHANWNPLARSPYAVFKRNGTWHVTYYDDALSLALRTALAAQLKVAGVGVWALGMDGADPSLIEAVTGNSPVEKPFSGSS